jgi:hypothetical protein
MRYTWIAIAMIVLLVGAAVAFGIGWSGRTARVPAPLADSPKQAALPLPPEAAPVVPQPRVRETAPSRPPSRAPSEGAKPRGEPSGPQPAAAAPAVDDPPAILESRPLPRVPVSGANVPHPTSQPTPPSSFPAGAPKPEPDKGAETSAPSDDPESDRRPPVLQNLRFDPPEIKGGGTAMLSVGAIDELSGVKFVYGSVRSPSGAAMVPFSARDLTGGGVFSATIAIPARGEMGDWFVASLQLVDKAENSLATSFARATVPEGGVLRVVSEDSDATAPTVQRVSVVKGSVEAGERNQIVVEVDDDRSGVAQVTGAFQSPSKSAFIPFTCARNGESPTWEGDVRIPENADCGEWTLRQLRVVDKANNSSFLSMDAPQVGRVSFLVAGGGGCDAEPPVVDALFFSPAAVSNATAAEIVVTVRAHDEGSGVASLSGWIDGPVATNGQAPRIYFECMPDPRDKDGPMTARITVPQFAAKGVWKVTLAQVADKARNTRAYNRDDPALKDATFTVN